MSGVAKEFWLQGYATRADTQHRLFAFIEASTIGDLSTQPSATSAQSRWSAGRLNPPSTEAGKITIQRVD